MKKQLAIIGIVVLFIIIGLSGCTTKNNNENQINNTIDPERNRFIGLWKTNPVDSYWTLDFFSNGTFQRMDAIVGGTYEIKEGNLNLNYTDDIWIGDVFNYNFSNNDNTLTLMKTSSNVSIILYKQ